MSMGVTRCNYYTIDALIERQTDAFACVWRHMAFDLPPERERERRFRLQKVAPGLRPDFLERVVNERRISAARGAPLPVCRLAQAGADGGLHVVVVARQRAGRQGPRQV